MRVFCPAVFAILIAACTAAHAQTPGSSPGNPAPAGVMLSGIVECGEGYTSHELYDMKIKLVEAVRGEEAWKRLKEASPTNKPPDPGLEYILARIRFEYYARGIPGTCIHSLSPDQFTAYSHGGEDYKNPVVVPPKPELRKDLKSGDIFEGWVAFQISKQDKSPLMSYSAESGGAVSHGGEKWFSLK
jgi:hypothetical protein